MNELLPPFAWSALSLRSSEPAATQNSEIRNLKSEIRHLASGISHPVSGLRHLALLSLLALFALVPRARAGALSASWTGGAGNWSDPANWSTAPEIPDNGSNTFAVTVDLGGPVMLDQNATIDSLSLTADLTNSGAFNLSVLGDFTWTGGTLSGPGTTTVGGRATLKNAALDGHTLVLNATGRLESDLSLLNGARIENHGQFQFYRSSYSDLLGYSSTFLNDGTFLQDFADLNQIQSAWQQTTNGKLDLGDSSTLQFLNNSTFAGAIALGSNGTLLLGSTTESSNTTFTFGTNSTITGGGAIDIEQMSGLDDEPTANFNGGVDLSNGTFLVSDGSANVRVGPDTRLGDTLQELELANVKLTGAASNTVYQISQLEMGFQSAFWTESLSNLNVGTLDSGGAGDIGAVDHLNLGTQTFTNGGPLTLSNTDLTVAQTGEIQSGSVLTLANSSLTVTNGATLTIYGGSTDAPTTIQGVTNAVSSVKFRPLEIGPQPQGASPQPQGDSALYDSLNILWRLYLVTDGGRNNTFLMNGGAQLALFGEYLGLFELTPDTEAFFERIVNIGGIIQMDPGSHLNLGQLSSSGKARFWIHGAELDIGRLATPATTAMNGQFLYMGGNAAALAFYANGNPQNVVARAKGEATIWNNMMAKGSGILVKVMDRSLFLGDMDCLGDLDIGFAAVPAQYTANSHTPHPLDGPSTTGHFTVTADSVTIESGLTSRFEIAGTDQGSNYDWLEVVGNMTVGGTLDLSILDGFQNSIQSTDTFAIITSSNAIAGAFTNVADGERLATSDGLGSFVVNYGPKSPYDPSEVVLSDYQPPQTRLITPAFQTGGAFGFATTGPAGQTNVIEASTNLQTWVPIATNPIPTSGVVPFMDNDASNHPMRFYRARQP